MDEYSSSVCCKFVHLSLLLGSEVKRHLFLPDDKTKKNDSNYRLDWCHSDRICLKKKCLELIFFSIQRSCPARRALSEQMTIVKQKRKANGEICSSQRKNDSFHFDKHRVRRARRRWCGENAVSRLSARSSLPMLKDKNVFFWFLFLVADLDTDYDDEGLETFKRYKPRSLDELASRTKFSKKEIQLIYQGFKQECPSGMIH